MKTRWQRLLRWIFGPPAWIVTTHHAPEVIAFIKQFGVTPTWYGHRIFAYTMMNRPFIIYFSYLHDLERDCGIRIKVQDYIGDIISHEVLHTVLADIDEPAASHALDNLIRNKDPTREGDGI